MSRIVQEKFQVNYPQQDNDDSSYDGGKWVTDASARAKKNQPGREGHSGGDYDSRYVNNAVMFHSLPPGMDIEDQEVCDIRQMGINVSGGFPVALAKGDRTQDLSSTSVKVGFDRKELRPTDDMYTREHQDAFYEECTVDGVTGFLERNNMLDRS
jgi:hypothetical protein